MFNAGLRDEGLLDLNLIWSSATRSWWLVSNSAPLKTLEFLSGGQRDFTRTWSISAVVLPSLEYQVKPCLSGCWNHVPVGLLKMAYFPNRISVHIPKGKPVNRPGL